MNLLRFFFLATTTATLGLAAPAEPFLFEWERGFGLRIPHEPTADMFLWFYEWNMFEAMEAGPHTHGTYHLKRTLNSTATGAVIESPGLHLTLRTMPDGAELVLRVTNRTSHPWPEIAGIIPCWNPGQVRGTNPSEPLPLNANFSDPTRRKSFFISAEGLVPLANRELHFNTRYRTAVDRAAEKGAFVFSPKWPTSAVDATAGLLVRESEDGQWVTGIAWDDFLSTQGHNPWSCLHACIRVGALKPGETCTRRGRIYLFRGTKEDCVKRFHADFPATR
ncbi:MAG: hypothetical protein EXS37_08830 [Opitutus sp.]|nr:hypothetical protein [Opitutus sp.]